MATKTNTAADLALTEITHVSRSVVAPEFKRRYRERAQTAKLPKGTDRKVIARSCGDWLAVNLARLTVGNSEGVTTNTEKRKANRVAFAAILAANGIEYSQWEHLDNGRFRMTGGHALRRVIVDNEGVLHLPDSTTLQAPRSWVVAHTR